MSVPSALGGSIADLRSSGAASGDVMNLISSRATSCFFEYETLFLAFELEVTSDMTFNNVGRDALVVSDELVGQSGTGKVSLRLRKDRLFQPAVHGDRQRTARESDLHGAGVVSRVNSLVHADIFRQDLRSHLHRGFLSVRDPADPGLFPVIQTIITD